MPLEHPVIRMVFFIIKSSTLCRSID